MRVSIENFEIIKKAELEFIPGLNVIVGPTNNGKSSIFRALESALFNELGDDFINNDENESTVVIEDSDNKISWNKRRNKSPATVYEINGTEYSKVGRTQFDKVADTMNISEVRLTSNDKERLNFWQQMEYPFLLDKTGSQLFEFLSLSSENENLAEVVKEMEGDKKDIKSKINKVEGGIDSLQEVIRDEERYLNDKEGFSEVYTDIINVESKIGKYEDLDVNLSQTIKKKNRKENLEEELDSLEGFLDVFLEEYRHLGQSLKKYITLEKEIKKTSSSKNTKESYEKFIREVNRILNSIDLENLLDRLSEYQDKKEKVEDLKQLIRDVRKSKNNYSDFQKQTDDIKNKIKGLELDVLKDKISKLDVKREKYQNIKETITEINNLSSKEEELASGIITLEEDYNEVMGEIDSFDICPLCNNKIKSDE